MWITSRSYRIEANDSFIRMVCAMLLWLWGIAGLFVLAVWIVGLLSEPSIGFGVTAASPQERWTPCFGLWSYISRDRLLHVDFPASRCRDSAIRPRATCETVGGLQ